MLPYTSHLPIIFSKQNLQIKKKILPKRTVPLLPANNAKISLEKKEKKKKKKKNRTSRVKDPKEHEPEKKLKKP